MLKKLQYLGVLSLGLITMASAVTFTDQTNIPSWGLTAVDQLVEAGIIGGNDDGSLAPWRQINRAEFLKILTSATDVSVVNSSGTSFPDVPDNAWFSPYVHTAVSQGWAKGYPDGTFQPGNLINRAEIAKLISEAWDLPLEINANDANWFDVYVRALVEADRLPYGATLTQFNPGKNPSRIEVFEQLYRTWEAALASAAADLVVIPAIEEETEDTSQAVAETDTEESGDDTETAETETETENNEDASEEESEESESEEEEEEENSDPPSDPTPPNNPEPELPPEVVDESILGLSNLTPAHTQIIYPGQGGITAFSAELRPVKDTPVITSITFSHEGNAPVSNFSRMWITDDSERISQEIVPEGTQNLVRFEPALWIEETMEIFLKLDTPSGAQDGYTSRWRIESINDVETTTDMDHITFPIDGQWMEIYPE